MDMNPRSVRILRVIGVALGCLLIAVVLFALLFDWNSLRPAIARAITARTGRPASIDGNLTVHLLSFTPSASIEGLKLANPAWAAHPLMLELPRLTVAISLGRLFTGHLVITRLEATAPQIDLEENAGGHSSWEFSEPKAAAGAAKPEPGGHIPPIRRLEITGGRISVELQPRKLALAGTVSADEGTDGGAFRLAGRGSINAKPFAIRFAGGPLTDIEPDKPYTFDSHITAGDISTDSRVTIPRPFDLTEFTAAETIQGDDLANVFYLTGLALPNTPPYRVQGVLHRSGSRYRVDHLQGRLGSSDISGDLAVDDTGALPRLTGALVSKKLDLADLAAPLGAPAKNAAVPSNSPDDQPQRRGGTRVPARNSIANAPGAVEAPAPPSPSEAPPEAASGGLLPDADLQVNRVRNMDADVTFRADSVIAQKLPMQAVLMHVTIEHGQLRIDPLSFVLPEGRISGAVHIDARESPPQSTLEMHLEDVRLSQFKGKGAAAAPLEGTLVGRLQLHGAGSSIHKFAAAADGTAGFSVENGQISSALAQLTAINVAKGLGLLLAKDEAHEEIRCGVADFAVKNGVLGVENLVIDTADMRITGRGDANLGTEKLDFSIEGQPKKLSFVRLRSPITLHGSLSKPSIGIAPGKLLAQVGAAAALGALLTPVAAVAVFVDPGLAKNADCAALARERP
jgi:uncharacterized protein involved in outer membrane biogenesis